jgi:hypothetical protein
MCDMSVVWCGAVRYECGVVWWDMSEVWCDVRKVDIERWVDAVLHLINREFKKY